MDVLLDFSWKLGSGCELGVEARSGTKETRYRLWMSVASANKFFSSLTSFQSLPSDRPSNLSEAPLCFACLTGQPHLCRREGRRQSESTLPALSRKLSSMRSTS